MRRKSKSIKIALLAIWCLSLLTSVSFAAISPAERKKIENAIPEKAPAVPKQPRKLLVFNLDIWNGAVRKGHTSIPYGNLALEKMGRKTKAYETVVSYGKGRVFYPTLGHNPHIFWNPPILQHYLAGIQFALGDLAADTIPSKKLTDEIRTKDKYNQ